MRLLEEIGGNITGKGKFEKRLEEENKKCTFRAFASRAKKESKKHHNCTIFVGIGTQYGRSNSKKKANDYHTIEVQNHPDLKFKKQD